MGRVLLVRDTSLEKELALKLLLEPPEGPGVIEEFQREFALLSKLEHPSIARAFDFGYLGNHPYFTSEFIAGEPLAAAGAGKPAEEVVGPLLEVVDAVAFLHRAEILHLDIKPANIMLRRGSGRGRAVLIDFGIFRGGFRSPPGRMIKGSLPYLGPEYFRGGSLGPWTDVYSLGVTFYRALSGRFPRSWREGNGRASPAIEWDPLPAPPSCYCPSLPSDLDQIVLRCLALDPASRFRNAGELLEALKRVKGGAPVESRPAAPLLTIGRDEELTRARRFLDHLPKALPDGSAGASTLVITGQAGMGQTHFLREVKIEAQTRGFRFVLETGYPGRNSPPGSLLRSLADHLQGPEQARWETFLSRLGRPRRIPRAAAPESEQRLARAGEVARMAGTIRDPLVLAVDGLQFWDEISVELLIHLVRFLGSVRSPAPPVGVVVGYREEGTALGLLRELTGYLLSSGRGEIITLRPLEVGDALELHRRWAGGEKEVPRELRVFQESGGSPGRLLTLTSGGPGGPEVFAGGGPGPRAEGRLVSPAAIPAGKNRGAGTLSAGGPKETQIVLALSLLRRPSTESELAALAALSPSRTRAVLKGMESRGLIEASEAADGRRSWSPAASSRAVTAGIAPRVLRGLHQEIAAKIARRISGSDDPLVVEAAHHFRLSGDVPAFIEYGFRAARYLKETLQNRAALDLFRVVREAIPRRRAELRLEAAFEVAELQARVGELDQAIAVLKDVSDRARRLSEAERVRVHLRLAVLYSRRGDFGRAEAMFREGLAKARQDRAGLEREELLLFLNEHAAMKVFVGEYQEALKLCEEGLRLAGRARSAPARQIGLGLYATRANVRLRNFDYPAAIRDLETSLQVAETIGSPANQAVVLNNLAIVYSNCDRYREAIHAFRDAEKTGLSLDEGPTLLAVYGNLAVLEAKTGDFGAMEGSLAEVERLCPAGAKPPLGDRGGVGDRQELCLHHSRGLCLLYRGAYAAALPSLEASVRLAETGGDLLLAALDGIHHAEALVFLARYGEAERELVHFAGPGLPARVRKLALSRRAFLAALTGDAFEAERCRNEHRTLHDDRSIAFLEAWDDLWIGWSLSLTAAGGRAAEAAARKAGSDQAASCLERAESFFRRHGLGPAAALAAWVRAEASFLAGDPERARQLLDQDPRSENDLLRVLRPLLWARLLLAGQPAEEARERCADLLARAGAALVGNPLPEWSALLAALRAALGTGDPKSEGESREERRKLALGLPGEKRRGYLESGHFRAWTSALEGWRRGRRRFAAGRSPSAEAPTAGHDRTRPLTRRLGAGPRAGVVAKSPAMRRLTAVLDRIRDSELPVLIRGETGSGKELVARIIHHESRRGGRPFVILDCAAIPVGLLEAELFGARAGAFTDLKEDRPGVLALAAGGTVLVDEVAGASLEAQGKLLRVLSEGTFRRLGDTREERLDIRFLFSTALDLEAAVREGRFRADLFHRVRVLAVEVPPLRERPEDLRALVEIFLRDGEGSPPALGRGVIERLRELGWPGNVRELRNLILRLRLENPRQVPVEAIPAARGDPDTRSVFPRNLLATEALPELRKRLDRDYLLYHLRRLEGDSAALCRFLGLSRPQLYRLCRHCGIRLKRKT